MATFIPHHNQSDVPDDINDIQPFDDFYPALSLSEFRRVMRVDDTVSHDRAIEQMRMAMMMIAKDIADWRSQQTATELLALGDEKIHAYRMTVFNRTKALIIENYRDIDTTKDGHERGEAMGERIDTYLQRSREMQSILTAKPRTTIFLV